MAGRRRNSASVASVTVPQTRRVTRSTKLAEVTAPAAVTEVEGRSRKRKQASDEGSKDTSAFEDLVANQAMDPRKRRKMTATSSPDVDVAIEDAAVTFDACDSDAPAQVKACTACGEEATTHGVTDLIEANQSEFHLTEQSAVLAATDKAFDPACKAHIALVHAALHANLAGLGECQSSTQAPVVSNGAAVDCSGAPQGRQQQFRELFNILESCTKEGLGRAIYISGLPGTGKSHTVRAVLSALADKVRSCKGVAEPCAVSLSCYGLKDPSDVYGALLAACQRELAAGKKGRGAAADMAANYSIETDSERAHHQLVSLLQSCGKKGPRGSRGAAAAGAGRMFVLVLDEVDRLLQRGTDDLYRLFMLPHVTGVRCCVVSMANSIDITERCLPALKTRGCAPAFLPFTAYSRLQVASILNAKLSFLPWQGVFDPMAIELVSRKVAGSTGDLRKAFQACKLALRLAHEQAVAAAGEGESAPAADPAPTSVAVQHMAAAVSRISYQSDASASHVTTIRNLPQQQLLHLLALATSVATTAVEAAKEAAAKAAAQEHGLSTDQYRSKYYWGPSVAGPKPTKASNPFAAAAAAPEGGAVTPRKGGAAGGAPPCTPTTGMLAGDAARTVPLSTVYDHYRHLCSHMFQQPGSEQELRAHMELLSHMGLVSFQTAAGGTPSSALSRGRGGAGAALALKAQIRDIQAALKDNAVFKKVLASLPAA